jgi:hypothetical protein
VRNERQRDVLAPRLLPSILKIQPLLPAAFRAAQLILVSTDMQVDGTMTAVVWHASRKMVDSNTVTSQRYRRDQPERQPGWDRPTAITATATGACIGGRRGLFLGQLMLPALKYDALQLKKFLFMAQPSPRTLRLEALSGAQQVAMNADGPASRTPSLGMFVAFYRAT